jgi:hypothetical protein
MLFLSRRFAANFKNIKFMKQLFTIFSFCLLAFVVRGEGKYNDTYLSNMASFMAMTGSGSLDINPLFDSNPCTASGSIDLNLTQGTLESILWNDGSTQVIRQGLGDGEYFVDLTIDGCDTTLFFNLEFPDLLAASVSNLKNKNCVEGTVSNPILGSFNVNTFGGEAPYTYSLNGQVQVSNVFSNLEEGTYVVDITDANGCQAQVVQEIKCIGCRISGNPVKKGSQFFVDVFFGNNTEYVKLSIYNSNGRRVRGPIQIAVINGQVDGYPITADMDAGMYLVLLEGDSISFSRQLIVVD